MRQLTLEEFHALQVDVQTALNRHKYAMSPKLRHKLRQIARQHGVLIFFRRGSDRFQIACEVECPEQLRQLQEERRTPSTLVH